MSFEAEALMVVVEDVLRFVLVGTMVVLLAFRLEEAEEEAAPLAGAPLTGAFVWRLADVIVKV
jgi:hypothetical protein